MWMQTIHWLSLKWFNQLICFNEQINKLIHFDSTWITTKFNIKSSIWTKLLFQSWKKIWFITKLDYHTLDNPLNKLLSLSLAKDPILFSKHLHISVVLWLNEQIFNKLSTLTTTSSPSTHLFGSIINHQVKNNKKSSKHNFLVTSAHIN